MNKYAQPTLEALVDRAKQGLSLTAAARTMAAFRLDLGLLMGGRQWESPQKQGWRQGIMNAFRRAISDGWRPVVEKCFRGS